MQKEITSKTELDTFLNDLPIDTLADRTWEDLQAGNFDDATFTLPDQTIINVTYTGE